MILGNSDIASDDMYYAHLYNFSVLPLEIDGCIAVHTDGPPWWIIAGTFRNGILHAHNGLVCAVEHLGAEGVWRILDGGQMSSRAVL